jgi:hypothetical protein
MNKLSGDKNTDMLILMKLNDNELAKVCSANKYINSICQDRHFWNMRTRTLLNVKEDELHELRRYLNLDGKQLYIYLVSKEIGWKYTDLLILFLLKYQNTINEIVENAVPESLPKYINKDEYIYFLRGTIAKYFLEHRIINVGFFNNEATFFTNDLDMKLLTIINKTRVSLPENMTKFVDKYIKDKIKI